ncbi:hypothetical protein P7C71_g3410, partial [Lecanoromycetidae sp. Uapishka_2]
MSGIHEGSSRRKVCFVTIGATAGFDALLRATLDALFLEALRALGYTDLRLQYGKEGRAVLQERRTIDTIDDAGKHKLNVSGFDFKKHGLESEMRAAKGGSNNVEGVVISHAGSQSPSSSSRTQVYWTTTRKSWQKSLHAKAMSDLSAALRLSESLRKSQQAWPPDNSAEDPSGKGLIGVMDDELGFVD